MTRRRKDPLRPFTSEEQAILEQIARAQSEPASHVARAKALLAVAAGKTYGAAAQAAGRRSNDAVSELVSRFNQEGVAALAPRHGGGPATQYGPVEQARILVEARRQPDLVRDGTANWSLSTLQRALRTAEDGLPTVSTYTIWVTLRANGFSWQQDGSWCETGKVLRKRKAGVVEVIDPDATPQKKLIEQAYSQGETMGLAVWTTDQAGPFQTKPYPGHSWQPSGRPRRQAHEYIRNGTAKLLTLFHPADGQVRVKGVTSCPNTVLHPWLKQELSQILATLPQPAALLEPAENRARWAVWFEGLSKPPDLPSDLPPLRMLLVIDNLAGHKSSDLVQWFFSQGIIPLYTPLAGSWLNMTESVQRILQQRALAGQHPTNPAQIIDWLETAAQSWNRAPTPFEWGGKRAARRVRQRQRQQALQALGGSGACIRRLFRRPKTIMEKWRSACQVTH